MTTHTHTQKKNNIYILFYEYIEFIRIINEK